MVDCALPSLQSLICGDTETDEDEKRRGRKSTPQDVDDFEADALWGEDGQESRSAYLTWTSTHSGYTDSTEHWPTVLEEASWQWCRDDATRAPLPRIAAGYEDRLRICFLLAEHSAGALKVMREARVIFDKLVKDCAAVTHSKKKFMGESVYFFPEASWHISVATLLATSTNGDWPSAQAAVGSLEEFTAAQGMAPTLTAAGVRMCDDGTMLVAFRDGGWCRHYRDELRVSSLGRGVLVPGMKLAARQPDSDHATHAVAVIGRMCITDGLSENEKRKVRNVVRNFAQVHTISDADREREERGSGESTLSTESDGGDRRRRCASMVEDVDSEDDDFSAPLERVSSSNVLSAFDAAEDHARTPCPSPSRSPSSPPSSSPSMADGSGALRHPRALSSPSVGGGDNNFRMSPSRPSSPRRLPMSPTRRSPSKGPSPMKLFGLRRELGPISDEPFELTVMSLAKEGAWGLAKYEIEGEFELEGEGEGDGEGGGKYGRPIKIRG
mmetsp:Transcript_64100/g.177124  ORF Transcript_64100/g.177124 Transcript_64100/m.177124 type:complete len:498 (-) Transcript_64100:84-1577(-)